MKNVYQEVVEAIVLVSALKVKTATAYLSPKETVKATLRQKTRSQTEVLLTIGRPNYREQRFIKLCQKAGETFPIKRLQLRFCK